MKQAAGARTGRQRTRTAYPRSRLHPLRTGQKNPDIGDFSNLVLNHGLPKVLDELAVDLNKIELILDLNSK